MFKQAETDQISMLRDFLLRSRLWLVSRFDYVDLLPAWIGSARRSGKLTGPWSSRYDVVGNCNLGRVGTKA